MDDLGIFHNCIFFTRRDGLRHCVGGVRWERLLGGLEGEGCSRRMLQAEMPVCAGSSPAKEGWSSAEGVLDGASLHPVTQGLLWTMANATFSEKRTTHKILKFSQSDMGYG